MGLTASLLARLEKFQKFGCLTADLGSPDETDRGENRNSTEVDCDAAAAFISEDRDDAAPRDSD